MWPRSRDATIFGIRSNISPKLLELETSNLVGGFVFGMPSRRKNKLPESGHGLGHVTPTIFGSTVGYPSDSLASCLFSATFRYHTCTKRLVVDTILFLFWHVLSGGTDVMYVADEDAGGRVAAAMSSDNDADTEESCEQPLDLSCRTTSVSPPSLVTSLHRYDPAHALQSDLLMCYAGLLGWAARNDSSGRPYVLLQMFIYFFNFVTRSPRSLGLSP